MALSEFGDDRLKLVSTTSGTWAIVKHPKEYDLDQCFSTFFMLRHIKFRNFIFATH